jgi:hypothetical protein
MNVEILNIHAYTLYANAKMIPVETTPGIRGGGKKENSRGGEFMCDIFDTL